MILLFPIKFGTIKINDKKGGIFLKKTIKMLLILFVMGFVVACGSSSSNHVEVTLPVSFVGEGIDIEMLEADAEEMGIEDVKLNDDGSVTYKMTKSAHEEWLSEITTEIETSLTEMVESGDFVSIKDITANNDYTEFTITVDQAAFENSFDGFAVFGIGISSSFYQLLDGKDPENYNVTINIVDEESGDVIDTTVFPDDLDTMFE